MSVITHIKERRESWFVASFSRHLFSTVANLAAPQNNGGTEVGGGAILASEGKKKVVSEVGG